MTAAEFPREAPDPSAPSLPDDERELWPLVAAGDRSAAERLVEMTYRRVWASLFKLTGGDADLAADLTQDTYRKAWAALPKFHGRSRFSTWIYRIAYNTFLSHIGRPQRLTPLDDLQLETLETNDPSPARATAEAAEARQVRRAILELPEELRFVVTARYWAELPVKEIAEIQGITAMGVRKRLTRAQQGLAKSLKEDDS